MTGVCENCHKRTETRIVTDDWTTRVEKYELCYKCTRDEEETMPKYRVFNTERDDQYGTDLADFLNDPASTVLNSLGWGQGVDRGIEATQGRCSATQGRLIALLVEKGVISIDEVLKIVGVSTNMHRHEIREVKE